MTKMTWFAGGLAVGMIALFLGLWFAPENGGGDKAAGGGPSGGAKPVEFDSKLAAEGKQVAESNGCTACHSVDGSKSTGPTWQGIYGTKAELADGKTVTVDDAYLTAAIFDPNAEVRKGSAAGMPSFKGKVSDAQAQAIVEYIKSLNE